MALNPREPRAPKNREQQRRTLVNMGFTIPRTGDAAKKTSHDHRESAQDPLALPSEQMETDLDAIDDDLLDGMLEEEDDMEVTVNPVLPPPPPPLPPIPFKKTTNKMPTTTTTVTDAAATTEKPDAAAQMMETFEKRMKAMQDQMAERERHHAEQIEDLTRQLKATTSRSETHRHGKTPRKPATIEEDLSNDETEVRQTRESDTRRARKEALDAVAQYRAILLKLTHAEHHHANTDELITSGLTPVWLQTDLHHDGKPH